MYAAIDPKTRKLGTLFALWWVPGAAAAIGVLIQDLVTFTVALVCFAVGGIVFFFKSWSVRKGRTLRGHNARSDKIPQTARTAGKRRRSAS